MKQLAWLLKLLLKAAIFFALFAFALNNQHDATVHFFFGHQWRTPLVLIVLTAFVAGVAVGIVGMVPRWWRNRPANQAPPVLPADSTQDSSLFMPPRHGL